MSLQRVTCIQLKAAIEKMHFQGRDMFSDLYADHSPSQHGLLHKSQILRASATEPARQQRKVAASMYQGGIFFVVFHSEK